MSKSKTMLFLEDTPHLQEQYTKQFEEKGWTVHAFSSADDARKNPGILRQADVALLDHNLYGNETGTEFGIWIRKTYGHQIGTAVYSAEPKEAIAKQINETTLIDEFFLRSAGQRWDGERLARLEELYEKARRAKAGDKPVEDDLWINPAIDLFTDEDVFEDASSRFIKDLVEQKIGRSSLPVLIIGETGTGKERLARLIHESSEIGEDFRDNYRAVNCAAFTEELVMSELFGHVASAFTGATYNKLGVILEAAGAKVDYRVNSAKSDDYVKWLEGCGNTLTENKRDHVYEFNQNGGEAQITGTLFLDEIGDLSTAAQAAVLRFLDSYGIRPIGYYDLPIRPRLRIIAATNKAEVVGVGQERRFRTDLLWRLGGWIIYMPTLKERRKDTLVAAVKRVVRFNKQHGTNLSLSTEALRRLSLMAAGDIDEGPKFSDSANPLQSGNFRHLNWVIDRACWLTHDESKEAKEISREILEVAAVALSMDSIKKLAGAEHRDESVAREAANSVRDGGVETTPREAGLSLDDQKRAVVGMAAFLDGKTGQGSVSLELECELAAGLCDLFCRRDHELDVFEVFSKPLNSLGIQISDSVAELPWKSGRAHWSWLCILGVLAAAKRQDEWSKGHLWNATKKVVGGKPSTAAGHAKDMLGQALDVLGINAVWKSDRQNGDIICDFLRLLSQQHVCSKSTVAAPSERAVKETIFHWIKEDVAEVEMSTAKRLLAHVAQVAQNLKLDVDGSST